MGAYSNQNFFSGDGLLWILQPPNINKTGFVKFLNWVFFSLLLKANSICLLKKLASLFIGICEGRTFSKNEDTRNDRKFFEWQNYLCFQYFQLNSKPPSIICKLGRISQSQNVVQKDSGFFYLNGTEACSLICYGYKTNLFWP